MNAETMKRREIFICSVRKDKSIRFISPHYRKLLHETCPRTALIVDCYNHNSFAAVPHLSMPKTLKQALTRGRLKTRIFLRMRKLNDHMSNLLHVPRGVFRVVSMVSMVAVSFVMIFVGWVSQC